MLDPVSDSDEFVDAPAVALRPSEYTAALIGVLRRRGAWARGAHILEIGSGSGVVLAALGELGAASLCGVDIESDAVRSSTMLLDQLGYGGSATVLEGDMWKPLGGRRFGLIAANLPHFPMVSRDFSGRLPTWSFGGPDGRMVLDRFLMGLPTHLAPGGRAIITHNAFVNLSQSQSIADRVGLSLRIVTTLMVHIPPEKLEVMTRAILRIEDGRTIHRYGPYTFGELNIVEIGTPEALG
jgi:release factor glutamine methyltransferase